MSNRYLEKVAGMTRLIGKAKIFARQVKGTKVQTMSTKAKEYGQDIDSAKAAQFAEVKKTHKDFDSFTRSSNKVNHIEKQVSRLHAKRNAARNTSTLEGIKTEAARKKLKVGLVAGTVGAGTAGGILSHILSKKTDK